MNRSDRKAFSAWLPGCWRCLLLGLVVGLQSCASTFTVDGSQQNRRHDTPDNQRSQQLFLAINQADAAYQAGHWKKASGHYRGVLEQMPYDSYAWFRLGNSLTRQGEYSHAIQAFEASLKHDARQTKPWFNLSTAHLLGAQLATLRAWEITPGNDPSRQAIQFRLDALTQLLQ